LACQTAEKKPPELTGGLLAVGSVFLNPRSLYDSSKQKKHRQSRCHEAVFEGHLFRQWVREFGSNVEPRNHVFPHRLASVECDGDGLGHSLMLAPTSVAIHKIALFLGALCPIPGVYSVGQCLGKLFRAPSLSWSLNECGFWSWAGWFWKLPVLLPKTPTGRNAFSRTATKGSCLAILARD